MAKAAQVSDKINMMPALNGDENPGDRARLGERIRGLRLERGLRLADVAALSGLSEPHLSRLEHGQRWPSVQVLLNLSKIYGVEASMLLWGPVAPAFSASHQSKAVWQGPEASGSGEVVGRSVSIRFDRASRLGMAEDRDEERRADEKTGGRRRAAIGSPEELLGMAYAGSFAMALSRQLESAGYEARRIETSVDVQLAVSAVGHAISEIRMRCVAEVTDIEEPTLREIAEVTKRMCVVGRALLGVPVTLDARLAEKAS